jgi:hypothetical protein
VLEFLDYRGNQQWGLWASFFIADLSNPHQIIVAVPGEHLVLYCHTILSMPTFNPMSPRPVLTEADIFEGDAETARRGNSFIKYPMHSVTQSR